MKTSLLCFILGHRWSITLTQVTHVGNIKKIDITHNEREFCMRCGKPNPTYL